MTTESTTTPKLKRRRLPYSLRMHWFTCLIICVTLAALIERQCEKEQIFGLANLGSFELYYTFGWPVASLKVIESGKIGSPVITNRVANLLPWKLAVNCSFGVLLTLATALCCERLVRSKRRIQFTLLQLFVVMAALGAVMSLTHRITVPCYHWDNLQGLSNEWSVIAWSDVIHPVRWPLLLALICLACVLVQLIGKILQMAYFATTKPHRRWLRFSLWTLLVLTILTGIGATWLAQRMQKARKQREASEAIVKLGGLVSYDYEFDQNGNRLPNAEPPGPIWLRDLLGPDFFANATVLVLRWDAGDNALRPVGGLTQLTELDLLDSQVTDAGMERIRGLSNLQSLNLAFTLVSDDGLRNLEGLTRLRWLGLCYTQTTDAGLGYLHGLTRLEALLLLHTEVTDAGLKPLTRLTQLTELDLGWTHVADGGMKNLAALTQLRILCLTGTGVTDVGLKYVTGLTRLEELDLSYTKVTDAGFDNFRELTRLKELWLHDTQVTDAGVAELQKTLPNCNIIR